MKTHRHSSPRLMKKLVHFFDSSFHQYFIQLLILWGLSFPLDGFLYAQEQDTMGRPNVLLIVVDDLGWRDVGYHGSEIRTPTLDKLAREGVELDRFYVHPACSPTRSSLMTGKAATRLGFINPIGKNNKKGLSLSEKILPQYFKDLGYHTSLVGKWHLGRFQKAYWPDHRGFDHFYGFLNGGIGHYDHVHGGGLDWQRNGEAIREEGYSTHLLTDEAIKIIRSRKHTAPFFLELCYAAPHMPNEAPKEAVSAYQHIPDTNRRLFAAMVSEVDKGIARIYQSLKQQGLLENTLIWFMSDNGGQNYVGTPASMKKTLASLVNIWGRPLPIPFFDFIRNNIENGGADNSPLKGGKNTAYEGGIRVPAFIYAPQFLPPQKVSGRITVNDVLPTLADAVGFRVPDTITLDGSSQWNALKQETPSSETPFVVDSRYGQAYFKDAWKLYLPKDGEAELYRIEEDPEEKHNLAPQHPDIVATLRAEMQSFPRGASVSDPLWKVILDPDLFGGREDRDPFAGREGTLSGPLHPVFYVIFLVFLIVLGVFGYLLRWVWRRVWR